MVTSLIEPADLLQFIAIGFAAQMVDGALGMAFGVISTTLLISLGIPPAAASASVHLVETFTTGVSGLSHTAHKNVDLRLLARLAIPGVCGAALGAYAIASIDVAAAKPIVLTYLALVGLYLITRASRYQLLHKRIRHVEPLGLIGGFLDAGGGGGWGPIVTSNLLVQGAHARQTVGTVSATEFFVAAAASSAFIATIGLQSFTTATTGLLIGGLIAAPFGAVITKRINPSLLMSVVGIALVCTSGWGLYILFR